MSESIDLPENSSFHANTGPKGVIADARSFETAKKRSFRQTLSAFSHGASSPLFGSKSKKQFDYSREKSPSPDRSASSDDEEFMNQWRANRLDELLTKKQQELGRRRSPSKRKYGTVVAVDPVGYLDAIEKVHQDTTVVVLIYDDEVSCPPSPVIRSPMSFAEKLEQSTTSAKAEDALDRIARKHNTVRFVKLHHLDAEMDEIAAPGILGYRGGECFANLVSIMSEVPSTQTMGETVLENILLQ